MYYATVVAAAVHQFILRSLRDAVTDDQVVVQNVASGEFCVLFVALGLLHSEKCGAFGRPVSPAARQAPARLRRALPRREHQKQPVPLRALDDIDPERALLPPAAAEARYRETRCARLYDG